MRQRTWQLVLNVCGAVIVNEQHWASPKGAHKDGSADEYHDIFNLIIAMCALRMHLHEQASS